MTRCLSPGQALSLFSLAFAGCTTPLAPGLCGNGTLNGTESCDDGNMTSGDGCSAICETERGVDAGLGVDVGGTPDAPSGLDVPDRMDVPVSLDAPGTLDVPGATDAPTADGGAPVDAGSPPPDGAVGAACGTRGTLPCAAGLDCVFPIASDCGRSGGAGSCQVRPTTCTRELAPVCGCDDADYTNTCEAHRAGTSVSSTGACPVSCDPDAAVCLTIPPRCVSGSTPRVRAGCWDGCVPLSTCTCASTADCPSGAACSASGTCG